MKWLSLVYLLHKKIQSQTQRSFAAKVAILKVQKYQKKIRLFFGFLSLTLKKIQYNVLTSFFFKQIFMYIEHGDSRSN